MINIFDAVHHPSFSKHNI